MVLEKEEYKHQNLQWIALLQLESCRDGEDIRYRTLIILGSVHRQANRPVHISHLPNLAPRECQRGLKTNPLITELKSEMSCLDDLKNVQSCKERR